MRDTVCGSAADVHDGTLVDAGTVVGTQVLGQTVLLGLAVVVLDGDIPCGHLGDGTGTLSQDGDLGIDAVLVLLAGGHHRGLRTQQGHGLTLHVGTHQGTVGVVVLQEGDHGSRDGHHHLGGHVHVIHLSGGHRDDLVAAAAGDTLVDEAVVLVHRLGSLADNILVFHIGGHILDLVGDLTGGLIHLAVGVSMKP